MDEGQAAEISRLAAELSLERKLHLQAASRFQGLREKVETLELTVQPRNMKEGQRPASPPGTTAYASDTGPCVSKGADYGHGVWETASKEDVDIYGNGTKALCRRILKSVDEYGDTDMRVDDPFGLGQPPGMTDQL